jgi:hypothetical protein
MEEYIKEKEGPRRLSFVDIVLSLSSLLRFDSTILVDLK